MPTSIDTNAKPVLSPLFYLLLLVSSLLSIYGVPLPTSHSAREKPAIWSIYIQHYGLDAKQARPDDTNWTGAEIKSCCRLASLLDVPLVQAAQNVAPVAVTAGDKIESLRQWASGRCLSADRAGVYSRSEGSSGGRVVEIDTRLACGT
jgi:hypothetical protein